MNSRQQRSSTWRISCHRSLLKCALTVLWSLSVAAGPAAAQCPTGTPMTQRWPWTTLEWTYSGGLSITAVSQGASNWNSREFFTTVRASTGYLDIQMSDSTVPPGLADIVVYNYGNSSPQSSCYLKQSTYCAPLCFNTSLIYYSVARLNNNNIGGAGAGWASTWGLTQQQAIDLVTRMTVGHEIAHILESSTNIDTAASCSPNPTILSVNDEFYCPLDSPTACDGSNVSSVYAGFSTSACNPCCACNLSSSCSN
jgi:hypothetical protein